MRWHPLIRSLPGLLLYACALSPGMRMDTGGLKEPEGLDAQAANARFRQQILLEPITPQLIARQLTNRPHSPTAHPELTVRDDDYQYRIAPQDVLHVMVWDHPELTSPAGQYQPSAEQGLLVRKDGTIFYPYVGVVYVAGMTVEEVRQLLTHFLKSVIEKPQLNVRVAAYRGRKVYVTGQVAKPGPVPLTDAPLHILDALYAAGGVRQPMNSSAQFGHLQGADLQHVTLTRNSRDYTVDVLALLTKGDMRQNYLLQDGDMVHVPDNMKNKVFVMGEVKSPSSVLIHQGSLSLAEALADAKGVNMASANPGRIYVIRGGAIEADASSGQTWQIREDSKAQVFGLNARSPEALLLADQFRLQPHDVVFVSTARIVEWGRVLSQVRETIQAIAITRALTR